VDVLVAIGSEDVLLVREDARANLAERLAHRAAEPPRERGHRNADASIVAEWVVTPRGFGWHWRGTQLCDLPAEARTHGGEQALFADRNALVFVPVVEPIDDHGVVRKVDDRTDPEGPKELARAKIAHSHDGSRHSSPTGEGSFQGGS
jgi:hypothetical protein